MKKIVAHLVLFPLMVFAQTQTENYIKTKTYKVATTTSILSPTITQANQNVTYFDGLGRPIQQIAHRQSGSGKDIVTPIEYDGFGRQEKDYLPYVPTATASLNYKTTALIDVGTFYKSTTYENTLNPYSKKEFEACPLNRVIKQAAPGNDWAIGSGHEIKLDYQTNTSADIVKLFSVPAIWDATKGLYDIPTSLTPTDYLDYQLFKTITKNENWISGNDNTAAEFKNKEGQVVLKRTYDNSISHDTYYIYDQYSNLTFVIPPLVNTSNNITQTILDGLCYQYKYDSRNRLVEKKLPGKQWEFIVYDKLDRVVATGPALSPFNNSAVGVLGWLITKYDVFNRPIYTGWEESTTINNAGRVLKQNTMIGLTTLSESKTTTPTTIDSLTGIAYYTNSVAPTSFKLLTINYYDDYNFQVFSPVIAYTSPVAYNNSTLKPKGLPTGSWVRVLTTLTSTTGESSYILYDAKARAIKTFSTNYLGGYTQIVSNFNAFSERLNYTETRHKRLVGDPEIYVKDAYTYTIQDRLLSHTHKIGTSGTIQLLASNTYDQLGQLISKKVGNTSILPLQKVDYAYNIRGWLTGINNDPTNNLISNTTEKDLFGFKINYNTVENCTNYAGTALYNGNISETYWRTASDNSIRKYGYKYDNLNRLRASIYQKPGLIAAQTQVTNAYDENITYDKNGNITSLNRKGNGDPQIGATLIDDLTYVYSSNTSNQLLKVTESPNGNDYEGFIDANKTDDYTYDANVNLKTDANKGITEIIYNHLNLPTKITFGINGTISYLYNSVGQKIGKTVSKAPKVYCGLKTTITTDYLSGFHYMQTANSSCTGKYAQPVVTLQFFPTAEGYVKNTAGVLSYVFNYTDHLGNVRVSYEKDAITGLLKIIDENNYYPFGLKHTPYNDYTPVVKNMYKYNGKEYQDENIGGSQLNLYDYGARNYDPALGRWMNIDPKAEILEKSSPYVYALNCPIVYLDRDGELPILINGRVSVDSERATESYWTSEIVATIQGSGIANPGGQIHYVDGDRFYNSTGNYNPAIDYDPSNFSKGIQKGAYTNGNDPSERRAAGRMAMTKSEFKVILSKLERNSKGKIIEKIQIYTHSRGAAFGEGYTERLMELIKENGEEFADAENEIEFSYNMAPHQSWSVRAVKGVPTYSDDHSQDEISGNSMGGTKGAFTSDQGKGIIGAHSIKSFNKDLKAFTSAFLKGGSSNDIISSFVKTMKDKYNITVTVK